MGAGTGTTTLANNLIVNLVDNNANALDIQQGTDNYINITTTNASENISFGNSNLNPSFSFLGTGSSTFDGSIISSAATANAISIQPWGTNSGETGELRFLELSASGTNYTGFKAPNSLTSDIVYTLPSADGTLDYVLTWQNGSVLQWKEVSAIGGAGDITQVGDVTNGPAFEGTAGNELYFEGSASDGFEILLIGANPTQDETITLPANSGTLLLLQPTAVQIATGTQPLVYLNETGAGSPNLVQIQVGGTDTFIVDNSGNVAANGGSLTTTATTGNLFNTGATTLNIGGAATTLRSELDQELPL